MSFLQKLKGEGVGQSNETEGADALKGVAQLEVDLFQTDEKIVIFAPVAGADLDSIDIVISGDDDIVEIIGSRVRPEDVAFGDTRPEGSFFTEEVVWGDFYRKIILPEPVFIDGAEAKVRTGVLILTLPLHLEEKKDNAVKVKVIDLDSQGEGRS